ncbi:MAG TPA: EamA family transporter [Bacteriovoracaceae bacterium]|nr:EamA family transporter [Bacteriovoracaceae bacterium]
MNSFEVYSAAIGANVAFSSASMVFALYARRFSSMWINQVKVFVALIAFVVAMLISGEMVSVNMTSVSVLLLSGFAGLCVGDIFLFRAYATLGAGRSLILFSCQPLMLGVYGYFFLGQVFSLNQTLAVICMIICIFIFMLERSRVTGSWDLKSFTWAFLGISLDAFGVMLTRTAFEYTPALETFQVNVIRCLGGLVGFILINPKGYFIVAKDFGALRKREISLILGACICGCFLSLALYLAALKYAHVGTLTAISITGPVWVAMLESIYHRKLPNFYLMSAFIFFLTGFYLMVVP